MTDDPTVADLDRIKQILPHRYPFLLVDRIEQIKPFDSAVGIKNVTANEPHFQGHFPDKPIMPGVAIIEAMAQTAGVLAGLSMELEDKDILIYFMSLDKARFRRMVVPGDVLRMHVKAVRAGQRKVWKFEGRAEVDGELAVNAEFAAMVDVRGA